MKSTKNKLLSSIATLCVCFAMLIGSTYAWFTDTASTGVNKIQAGTLDIEAYYQDADPNGSVPYNIGGSDARISTVKFAETKKNLEGAKLIDETTIFEPGYVGAKLITVENKGNLAAKLALKVSTQDHGLQDALWFDFIMVNDTTVIGELDQRRMSIINQFAEGVQVPVAANNGKASFIFIYGMDEEAGNTYQGKFFEASVTIVAKQDTVENDSFDNTYDKFAEYPSGSGVTNTASVATASELKTVLTSFTDAGSGNSIVTIDNDITLAEGETWIPAIIDGYNGAGVITIEGNHHTISGLNAPLLAGGFAGNSGIIIKNLTLDNSLIDDTYADQGLGGFICSIDSMPKIELNNCHLKDSTITSTGDARVGGLIGWTAGYNNPNDGPVDTYITITNCSVENTSITAAGSVGAIIGHAGNNPATFHTITDCTVTGTTLNSTDDGGWRVGVVVGTANVGEVTITNTTESGNTLTQTGKTAPEHSNLFGRFVPGDTGELTIDGVEITEY